MISRAQKEKDIDGLWAYAYINYFKVIENIANEYLDNSDNTKINYNSYEWNNKVKDIIMQNYGISYPEKKLKYISKKISLCPYVAIISNDFISHSFFNIDYESIGINSSVHLYYKYFVKFFNSF